MISDAYFPTPYPEELLYSLLARYRRHLGMPKMMYMQDSLFANRHVIATYDLPGHLATLSANLPKKAYFIGHQIIEKLTLFNYLTAFQPENVRKQVREGMLSSSKDIHIRLGMSAFKISRLSQLQFCPICKQEMLDRYKELYWRRDHQLAGVYVCPLHGCPLFKSSVKFIWHSRHEYIAATLDNCADNAQPLVIIEDEETASKLSRLAQKCVTLLQKPPEAKNAIEWTTFYQKKIQEIGFSKSSKTINQKMLHSAFHMYADEILECIPEGARISASCDAWLDKLVRKQRTTSPPLYHLLLQEFLEQFEKKPPPFGFGPWACQNPLANHTTNTPITSIKTHQNHGKLVGVFRCSCGYIYTRNFDPATQIIGEPRLLHFGPTLAPALSQFISSKKSLREISLLLNIDPKTIVRLAQELKIPTPWNLKLPISKKALILPIIILKNKSKAREKSKISKPLMQKDRVNWEEIDNECAEKIKHQSNVVLKISPPIRISIAELERRIGKKDWICKYKEKLPKTMIEIANHVENIDEFQTRRIKWVINQHWELYGEIQIWRVMRHAGMKPSALEKVTNLVKQSIEKHK